MRESTNLFTKTKLLLVILFCIFIISSCKNPDNPCNLTPEQALEIRGIRLGMPYDEISEKFRIKCNLDIKNPQRFLSTKIRYSIGIKDVDWHNKTKDKDSEKFDLKELDSDCFSYSDNNVIGFNPSRFPELQGIQSLQLSFDESKLLTKIKASYQTKQPNKKFTIKELINSLNLSQWNNWYIEADIDSGAGYEISISRGTLLCNNLVIKPEITYFTPHSNTYSVDLDIEAVTDDELTFVKDSIVEAQNKEKQKRREEAEQSNAQIKKRMEEENKVRAPFKP